jgi:hypothetical protein
VSGSIEVENLSEVFKVRVGRYESGNRFGVPA